jgi:hypothetical protein
MWFYCFEDVERFGFCIVCYGGGRSSAEAGRDETAVTSLRLKDTSETLRLVLVENTEAGQSCQTKKNQVNLYLSELT